MIQRFLGSEKGQPRIRGIGPVDTLAYCIDVSIAGHERNGRFSRNKRVQERVLHGMSTPCKGEL